MTRLAEVLILGGSLGALYALMGASVTVVYQAVRVPNVAFVGIGTVAAIVHWDLVSSGGRTGGGLSWWAALAPALAVAVVLGVLTDGLLRRSVGRTVASFVLLLGWTAVLLGVATALWGTRPKLLPAVWAGPAWRLGDVTVPRPQLGALLIGAVVCVALLALYRETRFGLVLRASAEDAEATRIMGADPRWLSLRAWCLSSVLATLAVILVAYPVLSNVYEQTVYLPYAFGAALLGGFRSVPLAIAGGFILGVVPTVLEPTDTLARVGGVRNLVAFVLIAALMLRRPGVLRRLAEGERGAPPWVAPPAPPLAVPGWVRRAALAGVAGGLAVAVPLLSDDAALTAWTHGLAVFLVCASIVVLAGWCGEVPLGQLAFAGFGAYMAANLAVRVDVPHILAIPLAAACVLPLALVVGLPALRSPGRLPFAIVSVGLMVVGASFLWGPRASWFTGGPAPLPRPDWMEVISGRPAASYYLVALALAAAVAWFAVNLHRSRLGRAFAAVRDAHTAAQTLGIDPRRYRLAALLFSAFVAALGGVVHAYLAGAADPTRFAAFLSVQYLLYTVVGGATSLAGVAVVVWAFEVAPALGGGATTGTGPGVIVVLGLAAMAATQLVPGGVAGLARRVAGRLGLAGPPPGVTAPAAAGGLAAGNVSERGRDA